MQTKVFLLKAAQHSIHLSCKFNTMSNVSQCHSHETNHIAKTGTTAGFSGVALLPCFRFGSGYTRRTELWRCKSPNSNIDSTGTY